MCSRLENEYGKETMCKSHVRNGVKYFLDGYAWDFGSPTGRPQNASADKHLVNIDLFIQNNGRNFLHNKTIGKIFQYYFK